MKLLLNISSPILLDLDATEAARLLDLLSGGRLVQDTGFGKTRRLILISGGVTGLELVIDEMLAEKADPDSDSNKI